jgi:4'-phosphopantetheinyl transferase
MDVIAELADLLPATVTAEMMGVPVADRDQLKTWSKDSSEMLRTSSTPTPSAVSWPSAPAEARLGNNEIHLWRVSLNDFQGELPRFHTILSPDERVRASRFHFSRDRDNFVVCRGILRELLATYLHRDASTIEFSYGRFGKPEIAGPFVDRPLYFNTSHSGTLALYAVTSVCPVGVDVERLRPVPEFHQIASRFFAPAETDRLMALPRDKQMQGFFACWTCKEAVLKATGEGIGRGLTAIQVVLSQQARVLCVVDDSHAPLDSHPDWQLQRLWPAAGHVGAIAYRHDAARLSLWKISDSSARCELDFTQSGDSGALLASAVVRWGLAQPNPS